mmetsp:Transcript_129728/g.225400  ORF Transcript_129728/g.225400 Transcript_129728/m.225400 type:complete len:338 (-) Transcript_129728:129-1142(-)
MGQTESAGEGAAPTTPPEVEVSRRRQDYLHRLGIQKDGKAFHHVPVTHTEAPGLLESGPEGRERLRTFSSFSTKGADSNEAGGEADSAAPAEASGDGVRVFEMNTLDLRSQDDFRVSFLRKLSYEKVWVPKAQRPPKHQTVIIFDWDDTLLCTSFLNLRQDQDHLPPVIERHLRGIEAAAKKLLEMAQRLGHTFIITNAMNGWVEYSAAKYVKDLLPVLQKVRVISARGKYEAQFPNEVSKWKINAFLEVQRQLDSQIITNLISLGDSNFEMDAVHVMGKEFAQALVKTIKFRENPSPEELLKQLELVSQKFERIIENARNLKIGLERKWVGGQSQA